MPVVPVKMPVVPVLPISLRTPWSATSSESSGVIVARPGNATIPPESTTLFVPSQTELLKINKPVVPVKIIKAPFVDKALSSFIKFSKK